MAPMEARTSTAITGVSTQRDFPVTERRIWTNIQPARATISGGHTQFNAVRVWLPGWKTTRAAPVTPMATAGTTAHRWGCRVRRTVRVAMSAQPNPNPSSRAPVMVASVPPGNTTSASTNDATAPAMTEATMVRPAGRRPVAGCAGSGSRWVELVRLVGWVWVLMVVSFWDG